MTDNWDLGGTVINFWTHFGFSDIPIDDNEDDQFISNEKQQANMKNETKSVGKNPSSSKSVQPRSNPNDNQEGKIQKKVYQSKNKFINKIPKGKKGQFDLLQFIRYSPLFKKDLVGTNNDSVKPTIVTETDDNIINEEDKHS